MVETFSLLAQQYSLWFRENHWCHEVGAVHQGMIESGASMRMRRLVIWAVLGSFLLLFITLPLSHNCADVVASELQAAASHRNAHAANGTDSQPVPTQKQDVCQACLWSQTLHLSQVSGGPVLERAVSLSPLAAPVSLIPTFDFLIPASKRGPPPAKSL